MNCESIIMNRVKKQRKKNFSCLLVVPRRGGFALLFAIIASSLLLSTAVAIWNLALREVVLSSYGRESQIAFYAADTAAECALYWDIKGSFATSSTATPSTVPSCGDLVVIDDFQTNSRAATTTFSITSGTCASVIVAKHDPEGDGTSVTTIESFGHNVCLTSDPMRVERGFKISY